MKIKEIAFSCYAVTDFARARSFYEGVLGLKAAMLFGETGGMQWAEYEIGSATLSIGCAPGMFKPSPDGCSVALEVDDFPAAIATLKKKNVKFRLEPMETPVCHMAMVFDPDGNTLCIHKRKAKH
jgi:predicted enzyme related to lactoylglutathione lyase